MHYFNYSTVLFLGQCYNVGMKRTHRIKKVLLNTLLVLLTTFSFFVFSSAPKAATNSGAGTVQKSSTTYGTYSWMYSKSGILQSLEGSTTNWSTMSVVIDLNAYYSGNLTITISGVSSFANVGIFVQGAYIAQKSTNQVQVQLVYSNKVIIEFYSTTPYVSTSYNWSCAVGVGTLNKIDDSEASSLDNIDSTVSNISAAITSNTYGLPAIYNKLESIEDAIGTLSSINNYLAQSLLVEKMNLFPVWQRNALFWSSSMGTLMFDSNLPYFNYSSADNRNAYYNPSRLKIGRGKTLSFVFYCNVNNPHTHMTLYGDHVNDITVSLQVSNYVPNYPLYLFEIDFTSAYSSSNFFSIEFDTNMVIYPLFLGGKDLMPDDIHILLGTDYDNTYTRLLNQIATGIGNISQQQIIENNTNINNYNSYQQQINNVENNYYQEFNTYENNIENNNTFDFTGLSTDGVQVYHNMFSQVYGISLVKWPVLITLLGLVIVIILG